MNLTTICNGCIFKDGLGCFLGRETFEHKVPERPSLTQIRTPGYCNFQRTRSWQKATMDGETSLPIAAAVMFQEECNASVILLMRDLDLGSVKDLVDNIDSMRESGILGIQHLTVVSNNIEHEDHDKLAAVLNASKTKFMWSVDCLMVDEQEQEHYEAMSDEDLLHHAIGGTIPTNWFFVLKKDQKLKSSWLTHVKHYIKDQDTNVAAITIEDEDQVKVYNINAFRQMAGHVTGMFEDKIRMFDNWEDVCLTVKQ